MVVQTDNHCLEFNSTTLSNNETNLLPLFPEASKAMSLRNEPCTITIAFCLFRRRVVPRLMACSEGSPQINGLQ